MPDASIQYYPNFIPYGDSLNLAEALYQTLEWRQDKIAMYGKEIDIPRLQAWYGDDSMDYSYSGIFLKANCWVSLLAELKQRIESFTQSNFNSVLANCYRDQHDSVGWHSDDEPELGVDPVIASLSFGVTRTFHLKHKVTGEKFKLPLQSGSLLLMSGKTQQYWQHALLKSKQQMPKRINLTFRKIISQ